MERDPRVTMYTMATSIGDELRVARVEATQLHELRRRVLRQNDPTALVIDARDAEARIYEQEAADKPENVRGKIVEGKLDSWYQTIVLLEQEMHNPKFEGKSVQQLRDELTAKTGENVVIRRFTRFAVGQ